MAFYTYAWRDVRNAGASDRPSGTKDAPRIEGTVRFFTIDKASGAPLAADLLVPLKNTFSNIEATDAAAYVALAADAAAANANATVRANETTTADAFRWGKGFLQFGVGYSTTSAEDAYANINWKNLS